MAAALLVGLASLFDQRRIDPILRFCARNIVRLAGARLEVRLAPGFDPARTCLFVSNHVNLFDPFVVVRDLLNNRDLWEGVVMDRGFAASEGNGRGWTRLSSDLIKLRDIGRGCWNVDTLLILTSGPGHKDC